MGKTKLHQQLVLLDPGKAALLDALAKAAGIARQQLLREAVDDLLTKHRALISTSTGEATNIVEFKSLARLKTDQVFDEIARNLGLESFQQLSDQVRIHEEARRRARGKSKSKKAKRQ